MITLLQAGTAAYDTGFALSNLTTSGAFILTIVIAVVGYLVQARLQSVFEKYSQVMFPGGLTGAEVAENPRQQYPQRKDHPRRRTSHRPLQPADHDR